MPCYCKLWTQTGQSFTSSPASESFVSETAKYSLLNWSWIHITDVHNVSKVHNNDNGCGVLETLCCFMVRA